MSVANHFECKNIFYIFFPDLILFSNSITLICEVVDKHGKHFGLLLNMDICAQSPFEGKASALLGCSYPDSRELRQVSG